MPSESQVTTAGQSLRDYQLASAVATHAGLHSIGLVAISAELKEPLAEASNDMSTGSAKASVAWKASHEISESGVDLSVKLSFKVDFGRKPTVAMTCTYLLEYRLDSPPPTDMREDLLSAFARVNGVYNAWPYLREMVQNTSARMNLPPTVLPVFRVIRPQKIEAKADSTDQGKPLVEDASKT